MKTSELIQALRNDTDEGHSLSGLAADRLEAIVKAWSVLRAEYVRNTGNDGAVIKRETVAAMDHAIGDDTQGG